MKTKVLHVFFCLMALFCFLPAVSQSLVFHTLDGGLSTVSLPASLRFTASGDVLTIKGADFQIELPHGRFLAVTYSGGNGDVNVDGLVDVADVVAVLNIMAGNPVGQPGGATSGAAGAGLSSVPLPATVTFSSGDDALIMESGGKQASLSKSRVFAVNYRSVNGGVVDIVDIADAMAGTPVEPHDIVAEAVDLGLPSGTLWASMNVGASSPEDYGAYFAWGETTPQSSNQYYWDLYKWCNGSETTLTKYCTDSEYGNNGFTDGKTSLDMEDDAAHASWGGRWRMPTKAEFEELLSNTTSEWTTLNGVKGRKFTSKSNDSSIFLPAGGSRWDGELSRAGTGGGYWSSALNESSPSGSWYLRLRSSDASADYDYRACGQSVRPVQSVSFSVSSESISFSASVRVIEMVAVSCESSWTASSDQSWCIVSPTSGTGSGMLTVTATENTGISSRSATVTVKSGSQTKTVKVTQEGKTVYVDVSLTSLSFSSPGGSNSVTIGSNHAWTASSSQSWCTVSPTSGTGNGTLTVTATENTGTSSRSATVTLTSGELTKTVTVEQEGIPAHSCPDSNHPHWIDLGLPSGTQWRCCNEGASAPEAYGGYYTFGQVSSAPTSDQIKELVNNCSYEWTTQNGVKGGKFTGPNGGTIFLPAAGYRWYGELNYVGSIGYYWSSTPVDEDYAYELGFSSSRAYWDGRSDDRYRGQSVRPVR